MNIAPEQLYSVSNPTAQSNQGFWKMKTVPPRADPNTVIWRYMPMVAFRSLMNERCLWFRQFKQLQQLDENEGRVIPGFWDSVLQLFRQSNQDADVVELRTWAEGNLNRLRCFEYASC